ncbi:MAG: hypothetical protein ACJ71Z_08275 [Aeromicrobium sp.]
MTDPTTGPRDASSASAVTSGESRSGRERIAAVLCIVLLLSGGAIGLVNLKHDREASAARQAQSRAVTGVEQILSYRHATVIGELRTERKLVTGEFGVAYPKLVRRTIGPAAAEAKIDTQATVSAHGVVSGSTDKVVVLLFVDVTSKSPRLRSPHLAGSRIEVTMKKVGGSWRIADLEPV